MREIEAEARTHVERIFGRAYEAIPEPIKREVESRYITQRIAEQTERFAGVARAVLPKIGLPLILGALGLFMFLRR